MVTVWWISSLFQFYAKEDTSFLMVAKVSDAMNHFWIISKYESDYLLGNKIQNTCTTLYLQLPIGQDVVHGPDHYFSHFNVTTLVSNILSHQHNGCL